MLQTSGRVKLSASAVLLFVAVFLGLVGIPGMMDDLSVWQEWIADAREVIPWQWAMLVATGSLLGAIVPWIRWMPWNRPRSASTTNVLVEPAEDVAPATRHENEAQEFRLLEEEAAFVLEYREELEDYGDSSWSSISESRVYALEDKLKSLGVELPSQSNLDAMARLLGLIRNGNLDEARDRFLLLPY